MPEGSRCLHTFNSPIEHGIGHYLPQITYSFRVYLDRRKVIFVFMGILAASHSIALGSL